MENNNESKIVKKITKGKIVLIVILVITLLGVATNTFAGLMGYNNIFFMIKELTNQTEVVSKEELFTDDELIISYSTIGVCDGFDVQINSLITNPKGSDFESELKVTYIMKDKEKLLAPNLHTLIYDESGEIIGPSVLLDFTETREVTIPMSRKVERSEKLKIEFGYNGIKGMEKTVTLDLANQEIVVEGEEKVEKQSQVEMKKYIEAFLLENDLAAPNALTDRAGLITYNLMKNVDDMVIYKNKNKDVSEGKIFTEVLLNSYGITEHEVMDVDGEVRIEPTRNSSIEYNKSNDSYKIPDFLLEKMPVIRVLNIADVKYKNGKYDVTVEYVKYSKEDEKKGINVEELTVYKNNLSFSLNRNGALAKYKLLTCGDGKVVKEATAVKEENEKEEPKKESNENEVVNKKGGIGYLQFKNKMYSLAELTLEFRDCTKIKNYKDFEYDFDGDNKNEKVTIRTKKLTESSDEKIYSLELNGKEFATHMFDPIVYIVDLNKNDNKKEVVVFDYGPSDDPNYTVYAMENNTMKKVANEMGTDFQCDEKGTYIVNSWYNGVTSPKVYFSYKYIENSKVEEKVLNAEDIKDDKFSTSGLYFTEDFSKIEEFDYSSNRMPEYLGNYGIEKLDFSEEFEIKNVQFENDRDGRVIEKINVVLEDGRTGYLFHIQWAD